MSNRFSLAFLYVANDVIQHDKSKGGDFVRDFLPMLPSAIQHIVHNVEDENIHRTVKRIIQIWNERQIYPADAMKLLKISVENGVKFDSIRFKEEEEEENFRFRPRKKIHRMKTKIKRQKMENENEPIRCQTTANENEKQKENYHYEKKHVVI